MDMILRAYDLVSRDLKKNIDALPVNPNQKEMGNAVSDLRDLAIYFAVEAGRDLKEMAMALGVSTGHIQMIHKTVKRKFP